MQQKKLLEWIQNTVCCPSQKNELRIPRRISFHFFDVEEPGLNSSCIVDINYFSAPAFNELFLCDVV